MLAKTLSITAALLLAVAPLSADQLTGLEGQKTWVTSLAFSPDGKSLAAVGGQTLLYRPGSVDIWSLDGKSIAKLEGHTTAVWSVAFSPNGKLLATSGYDSSVKLWSVADKKETASLAGHKNWVLDTTFSNDCLLYTSPSPRDGLLSRMPSSA